MKYTIEDVAKEAGVSITTVSRVLNGNYPVKKETKERIEQAIKKLNYQPNPLARSLVNRKTNIIGVVVPSISNMYFAEIIEEIEKNIKKLGYDMVLNLSEGCAEKEKSCINNLLERFVDGIIVVYPQQDNVKSGFIKEMSNKTPFICISGYMDSENNNFVMVDEVGGAQSAMEHLIYLGHKKIAFIQDNSLPVSNAIKEVYEKYIKEIGREEIVIHVNEEEIYKTLSQIYNNEYILGKDITAFFASNDIIAAKVLNACLNHGLKVPNDVSIVSFGYSMVTQVTAVPITGVSINLRMLGKAAAEKILNLINNKELVCSSQIIETSFVDGESCREIKRKIFSLEEDFLL